MIALETEEFECPNGKEYQECGTSCPTTCKNKDEIRICTFECVQGKPHNYYHNTYLAIAVVYLHYLRLLLSLWYC